jgi:hypothetical protein
VETFSQTPKADTMNATQTQSHDDVFSIRATKIKTRIEAEGHNWGLTTSEIKQMQEVCDNIFSDERDKNNKR